MCVGGNCSRHLHQLMVADVMTQKICSSCPMAVWWAGGDDHAMMIITPCAAGMSM